MINHHRRYKSYFRAQIIAESLVKRGHSVTLVVIADTRRYGITTEAVNGVRIIETPDLLWGRLRSGWDPYDTIVRTRLLAGIGHEFDLIHLFETRPATIIPALFFLRKNKIPIVIDWIDWWGKGGLIDANRPWWYKHTFGHVEEYFEERFRPMADGTTVISGALADRAVGLGVQKDSILLLRGGVDADHFRPMPVADARVKAGISLDAPVLGFSSLDSFLDVKLLLEAITLVKKEMPGVKVLMTGAASPEARKHVSAFGLEGEVIFTGFLPFKDLPVYLNCCDLFLLPLPETPYNIGRWPNKVGDYMAIGRPVITNPTGELKDIFSSGEFGLTCRYDASDFAAKILELLRDPARRLEMGRKARAWAVEMLPWDKKAADLEGFYSSVIKRHGKKAGSYSSGNATLREVKAVRP